MSLVFLRLSVLAFVLSLVVGCGGGSMGGSTGGGGGSTSTAVTFTFGAITPLAVGAKIGSGAFTAQTLNSGKLSLTIPSGTTNFAVAYVCPGQVGNSNATELLELEYVIEASTADGTSFTGACPSGLTSPPTGTLTGKVDASAIGSTAQVVIAAANSSSLLYNGAYSAVSSFTLGAPLGSDRVLVLVYDFGAQETLTAAKDVNSQVVPGALNGGTTVILSTSDKTTNQAITYNGVPAGYTPPTTHVYLELGNVGGLNVATGATSEYPALPASAVESGDYYFFLASAQNSNNSGESVFGNAISSVGAPISFTFPQAWTYAGPAPAALPTFNFQYTGFSGKSQVLEEAAISWINPTAIPLNSYAYNYFSVIATSNYQNGATALSFPDLSTLPGFLLPPATGKSVTWSASIGQWSYGVLQTRPPNSSLTGVQNLGTYTVP